MTTVRASPRALRRYADSLGIEDRRLGERAAELRRVLQRYRMSSPDFGADHTWLADDLEAVATAASALDRSVHRVASAFERVALPPSLGAPLGVIAERAVRRVPAAAFSGAHRQVTSTWEAVDDLGALVVDVEPDGWRELVWGARRRPPCLGDYGGGGGVLGPDGRIYPLVVPELEVDGQAAHLSYHHDPTRDPATLGGADPGWTLLDEETGIARVNGYEPGLLARAAVLVGMTAGLSVPARRWSSPDELARVAFTPEGRPVIAELPEPLPHDPRVGLYPDSQVQARTRLGRASGVVDLVTGGMEGFIHASELHRPGVNVYRVLFEEHEDGARRARMHTYQLATTEVGSAFVPSMGYAKAGRLRRKLVTPAPPRARSMSQGPTSSGARVGSVAPTSRRTRRLAGW